MVFLVLAVIVTLTAAATVWLAGTRSCAENDPDGPFWYTFAGLCVLAPMMLIPAMTNNLASVSLLLLAGSSAVTTHSFLRRRQKAARAAKDLAALGTRLSVVAEAHQAVLDQWACYLLDPEPAAFRPAMTNIHAPATAALIRAMSSTDQLKPSGVLTHDGVASYQLAVTSLVQALATAEDAACPNAGS